MQVSMSRTRCRKVTSLFSLAIIFLSQSDGELIITPRNTESKVGETTYFNCSTDLKSSEIFWHHGNKDIYTGNGILEPYRGRFEIDRNASIGSHNLLIHSVEPGDAGEYICADDDGYRERISAQLIVLDSNPDCLSNIKPDGVIGQNVFNIPPDEVELTCNVTYYGNIPPQMEWKKVGDMNNSIIDGAMSHDTSDNRLVHTLQFIGDLLLDNSSYICQTTRSTQNQYTCTSEIIKVLYFVGGNMIEQKVFKGDEVTCAVKRNTFSCINQWHYDNYTLNETIKTQLLGEYMCRVKCRIRGTNYTYDVMKAFVAEMKTSDSFPNTEKSASPMAPGTIVGIAVVAIIIIAILAASIAVLALRYRKRKDNAPSENGRSTADAQERVPLKHPPKSHSALDDAAAEDEGNITGELFQFGREQFGTDQLTLNELMKQPVRAIYGLAVLGREVFISRLRYPIIEVYDSTTFRYKRQIEISGMTNPEHIVSCSVNNCLYAFDWEFQDYDIFSAMLKIDPTNGNLIKTWNVNGRGGRLSVASDTNVILNVNYESKLKEYKADGELIRVIILDSGTDIYRAWHAVKLPNGLFLVCHGGYDDPLKRVCLLSIKTRLTSTNEKINEVEIMKAFGGENGE